jgi:hypothetical protein
MTRTLQPLRAILAMLTLISFLGAGCSNEPSATDTASEKAVKFAE